MGALQPGGASADRAVNERAPITLFTENPCNGDFVELTGTSHVVRKIKVRKNGQTSETVHQNLVGLSGTGEPSGAEYNANGTSTAMTNYSAEPGAVYYTFREHFNVISKGAAPNFKMTTTSTVRFDDDGNIVVEPSDQVETRCVG